MIHRALSIAVLAFLMTPAVAQPLRAQHTFARETIVVAAGSEKPAAAAAAKEPEKQSPEEKMRRRFPQQVRVGDLIGLPLLDDDDRTIGRIKSVVRTSAGKIQLIIPYGGFLGWGQRLVSVPIEVVAIAGRQLAALDMARPEFETAPAWNPAQAQPIDPNEIIRIGLYKR